MQDAETDGSVVREGYGLNLPRVALNETRTEEIFPVRVSFHCHTDQENLLGTTSDLIFRQNRFLCPAVLRIKRYLCGRIAKVTNLHTYFLYELDPRFAVE